MPRFRTVLAATLSVSALLLSLPAEAKDKPCPPGLAKKGVPCVPPGQVGKSWQRGDRVEGGYVLIPHSDWHRLQLRDYDDGSTYLQLDNQILRVARDTFIVIEAIRIVDNLLD